MAKGWDWLFRADLAHTWLWPLIKVAVPTVTGGLSAYLVALEHLPIWQVFLGLLYGAAGGLLLLGGAALLRRSMGGLVPSHSRPMRRYLQVDSPEYMANGELHTTGNFENQTLPPGRFMVDVTDVPMATMGDVYDPIAKSFSPPLPRLILQFFADHRTPVATQTRNIHYWYALSMRPIGEPQKVTGWIVTIVFQKDVGFQQLRLNFSSPSLLPVHEVKHRDRRFAIIVVSAAIPEGELEIVATR